MIRKFLFFLFLCFKYPVNLVKKNKISFKSRISSNVKISNSRVGNYSYVGCNTVLNNVNIGCYSSIAPGVQIGGMEHSYWWFSTSTSLSNHCISDQETIIGNDVWIAAGSIIKQGVTIGDGAVIGAMSFVNCDIPENCIAFGIPAKIYKNRFDSAAFEKIKKSGFYNLDLVEAKKAIAKLENESK